MHPPPCVGPFGGKVLSVELLGLRNRERLDCALEFLQTSGLALEVNDQPVAVVVGDPAAEARAREGISLRLRGRPVGLGLVSVVGRLAVEGGAAVVADILDLNDSPLRAGARD